MTTPTIEEVAARLAALEARAGMNQPPGGPAVSPLVITVGELTDVPSPGSPIASKWAQEVSNRVVQRFANKAALDTWAAANGSVAAVGPALYLRIAGAWISQKTGIMGSITVLSTYTITPPSTYNDIPGTGINYTAVPGRTYKYSATMVAINNGAGNANCRLAIVDTADVLTDNVATIGNGYYFTLSALAASSNRPAGVRTAFLRSYTSLGNLTVNPSTLIVEDLGVL